MVNETGRSALTSLLAKMIVIFLHGRRGDENAIDFRLWLVCALIEQLVLGLLGVLRHQLTVVVLEWTCARQIKLSSSAIAPLVHRWRDTARQGGCTCAAAAVLRRGLELCNLAYG